MSSKLILFDIDGTLLHSHRIGTRSILDAIHDVLGVRVEMGNYSLAGRTDTGIIRDLLGSAGIDADAVNTQPIVETYLHLLEKRLEERPAQPFPGVSKLLGRLAGVPDLHLGLVTGNLERGARVKLQSAELDDHFPVGAFGSDHEDRNELPQLAIRRAEAHFGARYRPRDVVVVGDTPKDIACARHAGVQVLAVATGPYKVEDLQQLNPDHVVNDLSDPDSVVAFLTAS